MLLKIQRNTFFDVLSKQGFSADQLEETIKSDNYRLFIKGQSNLYFNVSRFSPGGYWLSARPGIKDLPESSASSSPDWSQLIIDFKKWAKYLRIEIDAPDLWAEAAKTAQLFAGTIEAPDDKFTRTELAEVQGQLRQLQQSFAAAALPEAARQKLIEVTENAAIKAESLTKKDWQNWIIGGFISSITSLALNPTQASEVLKLVKAAFGGLFLH